MNKRSLLILLVLITSILHPLAAQELTRSQKRQVNNMVLEALEEYEICSGLYGKQENYQFKKLFESPETGITCDLYNHERFLSDITVKEYCEFVPSHCRNINLSLSDIRKGDLHYDGMNWTYQVHARKSLAFLDENDILFPLNEEKAPEFEISFTYVFSKDLSECHIRRLEVLNPDDFPHGEKFLIVQKNTEEKAGMYDEGISFNGKKLEFNSFKQAGAPFCQPEYKANTDVEISEEIFAENSLYKYLQYHYKKRNLRLRIRNEVSPLSYYGCSSAENLTTASNGYQFGVDFGISCTISNRNRLEFYTGAGFSISQLHLQKDYIQYALESKDIEDLPYLRLYSIYNVQENAHFMDLTIPLYAEWNCHLGSVFYIYINAGAKFYLNGKVRNANTFVDGSCDTFYYGSQTSKNRSYTLNSDIDTFVYPAELKRTPVDITVTGNLGFDIALYRHLVFMEIAVGYERNLKDIYVGRDEYFYLQGRQIYPIRYDEELQTDLFLQPLYNVISMKRDHLNFNVGLKFKF